MIKVRMQSEKFVPELCVDVRTDIATMRVLAYSSFPSTVCKHALHLDLARWIREAIRFVVKRSSLRTARTINKPILTRFILFIVMRWCVRVVGPVLYPETATLNLL